MANITSDPTRNCWKCRYDLIGLDPGHACPECGLQINRSSEKWTKRRRWHRRLLILEGTLGATFALLFTFQMWAKHVFMPDFHSRLGLNHWSYRFDRPDDFERLMRGFVNLPCGFYVLGMIMMCAVLVPVFALRLKWHLLPLAILAGVALLGVGTAFSLLLDYEP